MRASAMLVALSVCVALLIARNGAAVVASASMRAADAPTYSNATAFTFFTLAMSAYQTNETLVAWDCECCKVATSTLGLDVRDVATFAHRSGGIFGFTAYEATNGVIIVSFQGTDNLVGWITDLRFPKTMPYKDVPHARVHDGFYHGYMDVRSGLHAQLRALANKYDVEKVWVTGHSLGAALATLCVLDLAESFPSGPGGSGLLFDARLISFGDPRVGNQEFAAYWAAKVSPVHWRVVHYKDIVPKLPPQELGFVHTIREVWYSVENSTSYKVCSPTNGEDPSCSDSVLSDSVYDHLHYFEHDTQCRWSPPR